MSGVVWCGCGDAIPGEELKCATCRATGPDPVRDALESMVTQFAYWSDGETPGLTTGFLSALEEAFEVLGWDDPHPMPSMQCDERGCRKQATCGWPSGEKYRRTCGDHMQYERIR